MNNSQINFFDEVRNLLSDLSPATILNEDDPMMQPGVATAAPTDDQMTGDPNQMSADDQMEGEDLSQEGMQDPEMQAADEMQSVDGSQQEPPDISDTRKLVHLFDNFDELRKMTIDFCDKLKEIDVTKLNDKKVKIVSMILDTVDRLVEKIEEYILNNFETKTYEENLYVYLLMRSELLTSISLLRKTLVLGRKKQ